MTRQIKLSDLEGDTEIVDDEGNTIILITRQGGHGHTNIDITSKVDVLLGARVFELGGPVQNNGPTISNRHNLDIPQVDDPVIFSVDFRHEDK